MRSIQDWQAKSGRETQIEFGKRREALPLLSPSSCCQLLLNDQRLSLSEAVLQARQRLSVAELCDQTLAPALVELGDLQVRGQVNTHQVLIACQRMRGLLSQLSDSLQCDEQFALRAVGASVHGDPADLSSLFAEVTLRELGWDAESLGSSLPGDCLGKAAYERQASIVWVCYTHQPDPTVAIAHNQLLTVAMPSNARLVIAGSGLKSELRRSLRFDFFGDSLIHLSNYAVQQFSPRDHALSA